MTRNIVFMLNRKIKMSRNPATNLKIMKFQIMKFQVSCNKLERETYSDL